MLVVVVDVVEGGLWELLKKRLYRNYCVAGDVSNYFVSISHCTSDLLQSHWIFHRPQFHSTKPSPTSPSSHISLAATLPIQSRHNIPDPSSHIQDSLVHYITSHQSKKTKQTMPLDTSTYPLSLLRLDGRRWNELRHITGQISTQSNSTSNSSSNSSGGAADGSSYLCIGNTRVLCTVSGPAEVRNRGGAAAPGGGAGDGEEAIVSVDISVAGFSGNERRRGKGGGGGDR